MIAINNFGLLPAAESDRDDRTYWSKFDFIVFHYFKLKIHIQKYLSRFNMIRDRRKRMKKMVTTEFVIQITIKGD